MMRTLKNIKNLHQKRVLVRVDYNVPLKNGIVQEDFKIRQSLPTLQYLQNHGAKIIIVSHLGRPQGVQENASLHPIKIKLEKFLKKKIKFFALNDLKAAVEYTQKMQPGEIIMLENIRFSKDEEKSGKVFAKQISELGDVFILDGFAVAHRKAASITGVAKYLPAYAGLLVEREVKSLTQVMSRPKKPLVVVLGGVKLETKIPVLKNLLPLADHILLGGGIANSLLKAHGIDIGDSVYDELPKNLLKILGNKKIILPVDVVVGNQLGKKTKTQFADEMRFGKNEGIYDIGPKTRELYAGILKRANTIVWNGAMGLFEQSPYQHGTFALAKCIAQSKANTVCGGGETVEVLKQLKLTSKISTISTGGGAMLEFLSGKKLPGIQAVFSQ